MVWWVCAALFLDRVLEYMTAEMTNLSPATLATSMWSFGIMAAGSPRWVVSQVSDLAPWCRSETCVCFSKRSYGAPCWCGRGM